MPSVVCWLPYIRFRSDIAPVTIGPAKLWLDDDSTWLSELSTTRPPWLDLFRDFPTAAGQVGSPVRGSLLLCQDEKYLIDYVDEIVGVLYFLCDDGSARLPAEQFHYHLLNISSSGTDVVLRTKIGTFHESSLTFSLYPSIHVRARSNVLPDVSTCEHAQLASRLLLPPLDRTVVAARHYFRSGFTDLFGAPSWSDFAQLSAAVEAACDIDFGTTDKFIHELVALYGVEYREFFRGWYVARIAHVHGLSIPGLMAGTDVEGRAFQYFIKQREVHPLCRSVVRDVILRGLRPAPTAGSAISIGLASAIDPNSAPNRLHTVLRSTETYESVKRLLLANGSASKIEGMSEDEFLVVTELASSLRDRFDWRFVDAVQKAHVFGMLKACALALVKLVHNVRVECAAAVELGTAADNGDEAAIKSWARNHFRWERFVPLPDRKAETMQLTSLRIAEFFSP